MALLFSNFPPLRTSYPTYSSIFKENLQVSEKVKIATGYISSDSAIDLKRIIEDNNGPHVELCVGMQYFDGLNPAQKDALESLNTSLQNNNLGRVYMVTTFPFHGKVVSFSRKDTVTCSIIGSSNLSNIIDDCRQYEADYLFNQCKESDELDQFIKKLITVSSQPLEGLQLKIIEPNNDLLANQMGVQKLTLKDVQNAMQNLSDLKFQIPLKGNEAPKSSLNPFFGEGRKNIQGFIIPRPWYEVELIVPKSITQSDGYPNSKITQDNSFPVITDDGWSFQCKVSGDYSKNFRSCNDLKILGKWIKGRLENAGALKPGELVTDTTFYKYGRSSIDFTRIKNSESWYLDFGVNNG